MRARVGYLGKRGQSGASAAAAAAARDAGSQRTAPSSPLVSLLRSSCCLLCLSSFPYTADAPAWYKCGCKAGDARCICPSFAAPRQLSRDQTPQFILLTVRTADEAGAPAGDVATCRYLQADLDGRLLLLHSACLAMCAS